VVNPIFNFIAFHGEYSPEISSFEYTFPIKLAIFIHLPIHIPEITIEFAENHA
jgi:hypothetical protein